MGKQKLNQKKKKQKGVNNDYKNIHVQYKNIINNTLHAYVVCTVMSPTGTSPISDGAFTLT